MCGTVGVEQQSRGPGCGLGDVGKCGELVRFSSAPAEREADEGEGGTRARTHVRRVRNRRRASGKLGTMKEAARLRPEVSAKMMKNKDKEVQMDVLERKWKC